MRDVALLPRGGHLPELFAAGTLQGRDLHVCIVREPDAANRLTAMQVRGVGARELVALPAEPRPERAHVARSRSLPTVWHATMKWSPRCTSSPSTRAYHPRAIRTPVAR